MTVCRFLAVLQTAAWKLRPQIRDLETSRMLCFLNTDRLPPGISRDAFGHSRSGKSSTQSTVKANGLGTVRKQSQVAARRSIQAQQMSRLAAPSGLADMLATGSGGDSVFTCQDGVTRIPYAVVGQAMATTNKCNLVVFHDLFDTFDGTQVFFRALLARNVGARVLVFNLPGQAGTSYPSATDPLGADGAEKTVLNNMWTARRVHEMLNYLEQTKAFITHGIPFHIVGFGNGANVATSYTILHGKSFGGDLQSLTLFNGFARVDAQLAAILHSAVNVFSCFPPSRPDLPVSFFSKFLFSDGYLRKIDPNLALSIYTAVTNPITLEGRIRVCQGALHHVDLTNQLTEIDVPLVLLQSVENALVAPANVDPFLQGRARILHAWSHQQPHTSDLRGKTRAQLRQTLSERRGAFVSWLRAGHELRQEAKAFVGELLEFLVNSREEQTPGDLVEAEVSDQGQDTRREVPSTMRRLSHDKLSRPVERPPSAANVSSMTTTTADTSNDAKQQSSGLVSNEVEPPRSAGSATNHRQPPANTTTESAPPAAARKSAYELQLERSEREFQEAVRTHEAQRAEFEKRKWLHEETNRRQKTQDAPEISTPASPLVSPGATLTAPAASPAIDVTAGSRAQGLTSPAPPAFPSAAISTPARVEERESTVVGKPNSHPIVDAELDDVRAKIMAQQQRVELEAAQLLERQRAVAEERMETLRREQEERRRQWEADDQAKLAALERQRREEEAERAREAQRRDQARLDRDLAAVGSQPKPIPIAAVTPTVLESSTSPLLSSDLVPASVAAVRSDVAASPGLPSLFDQMEAEERARKRVVGLLRADEFAAVKAETQRTFATGVRAHESSMRQELERRRAAQAVRIQAQVRRWLAMRRVGALRERRQQKAIRQLAGSEIVRVARGFLGRRRFVRHREFRSTSEHRSSAAVAIQRLFRGFSCRVRFRRRLRAAKARIIQRVFRGHAGRRRCRRLRAEQVIRGHQDAAAARLQATWRMHVARDEFLRARFEALAATEIQRVYRGHVGRRDATRRQQWQAAAPGPERLALGLQLLDGSKQAFERQQSELDALHRAQEAAERQVSAVHADLQASEQELAGLERELAEIDQLDADLRELTHEAEALKRGGVGAFGSRTVQGSASGGAQPLGDGVPVYDREAAEVFESPAAARQRQADAAALEMAVQIKKSERERRKRDLEAAFAGAFGEVQAKREALARLEEQLADMEATRQRKDRELARLQRNLMELLEEQKLELERLREKGIELETATATSAAAAAATAVKAREHEARSQAMFESTEELMKFQFMSMSLSYFSSLNMLKNLRDMNADTTHAAIASTAETAAAAAAAAAAANIPASVSKLPVGVVGDLLRGNAAAKQQELSTAQALEADANVRHKVALPETVTDWSVDDVGRWLEALALPQYRAAFAEGAVDGAFLLELQPADLAEVLGVTHKLHVKKIVAARDKLLPLTSTEVRQLAAVAHEDAAAATREDQQSGVPDLETVFSQARNGRLKRLAESLDAGFDVDAEDDKGNTLLLLASQNVNRKMVELLLAKRASVNHRNAQGNTALHFAMAYDTDGALGEFLIAHGADDSIENNFGLTPYDGLAPE